MSAIPTPGAAALSLVETRATDLWLFVKSRFSSFTNEAALSVIAKLGDLEGAEPKKLAWQLRPLLLEHGVGLKHTAALKAAAVILGHDSYFDRRRNAEPALSLRLLGTGQVSLFPTWSELATPLADAIKALPWTEVDDPVARIRVTDGSLEIWAALPAGMPFGGVGEMPLAVIKPMTRDDRWLIGATAALEHSRRPLEESAIAVMDGFAVVEVAERYSKSQSPTRPSTVHLDMPNASLVIERREDWAGGAVFEVGCGDELECFHQMELEAQGDIGQNLPINFQVAEDDDGAWMNGNHRYVWSMRVARPDGPFEARTVMYQLPEDVSKELYRRYRRFKAVFSNLLKKPHGHRVISRFQVQPDTFLLDTARVQRMLAAKGLTWNALFDDRPESYDINAPVPFDALYPLFEALPDVVPGRLLKRPGPGEMWDIGHGEFVRSVLPYLKHVSYAYRQEFTPEEKEFVSERVRAFQEFLTMRELRKSIDTSYETPYFIETSDVEEFLGGMTEAGFRILGATMPYFLRVELPPEMMAEVPQDMPVTPYSYVTCLYIEIERQRGT